MNISQNNLEILLVNLIGRAINTKIEEKEKYFTELITWGELLIELNIEKRYIYIHYKYYHYYKPGFCSCEKDDEIIEFSLSSRTDKSRENLQEIEERTYVNKNSLFRIINILEEM